MRRVKPEESPPPDGGWDRMPVSSCVRENFPFQSGPSSHHRSRNPVIADLEIERNELAQTLKTFSRRLSPEDRVEGEEPPTAHSVAALVHSLQSFWMSRPRQRVFGDAMALCDRFLPTIDTHARLLVVLPNSDRYHAPLFYGVLQSVLKVRDGPAAENSLGRLTRTRRRM